MDQQQTAKVNNDFTFRTCCPLPENQKTLEKGRLILKSSFIFKKSNEHDTTFCFVKYQIHYCYNIVYLFHCFLILTVVQSMWILIRHSCVQCTVYSVQCTVYSVQWGFQFFFRINLAYGTFPKLMFRIKTYCKLLENLGETWLNPFPAGVLKNQDTVAPLNPMFDV